MTEIPKEILLSELKKQRKHIDAIRSVGFDGDIITFDKLYECYNLAKDIIEDLSYEAILELNGGYKNDVENMFLAIIRETYETIYGSKGRIKNSSLGYLDKLTGSVDETLRTESLAYFITSVLPTFEMNWHHLEWAEHIQRYNRLGVIAARDHGKSFFFSNAYCAWRLYQYKPNYIYNSRRVKLSKYGYLFSFSINQAIELLRILKNTIEENEVLARTLLPENKKENWSKMEINCRNGSRLIVKGFMSSVRGAHPGYIVVDDPLKDNVIYSESQRQKSKEYFHSVIMNMIVPKGDVTVVGTPFHKDDLYADLKSKPKIWKVFEYPAIFPDGKILWSRRWDFKGLMEKRESQGNLIFSREILCRPISSDTSIFPWEILLRATHKMDSYTLVSNRESFPLKFKRIVCGVDFAISAKVSADYTVVTVWGIDDNECMWLLYVQRAKGKTYNEQIAILKRINVDFQPNVFVVETNQFQMLIAQGAKEEGLPIKPHNTNKNKYNLEDGLPGVAIKFERGKIKLPIGDEESKYKADWLMNEFHSIAWTDKGLESVDQHDDGPMSTWLATLGTEVSSNFTFDFI